MAPHHGARLHPFRSLCGVYAARNGRLGFLYRA
jgi:hypothetical protein